MANRWVLKPRGLPINAPGTPLLICLPQAGMGAYIYNPLCKALSGLVEVLPIEMPGHNSRVTEPLETDLRRLAHGVADAVQGYISQDGVSRPYGILGHSLGVWVGYEVAQELIRRGLPAPHHMFMVSNRAIHLCGAANDVDPTRMHLLPADEFWKHFFRRYGANPALDEPAMRDMAWPILKADFQMVETYEYNSTDPPLPCAMTGVVGSEDTRVTRAQMEAWKQHTTGPFQVIWLEGLGHNLMGTPPLELIAAIKQAMVQ